MSAVKSRFNNLEYRNHTSWDWFLRTRESERTGLSDGSASPALRLPSLKYVYCGAAMPFFVQGFIDNHMLTAATDTPKKAFAEAVEWHIVRGFGDVSISDGVTRYSIAEFASAMALREISETKLDG